MKLAILSMQNIQNFGSLLQSYSLMKLLILSGHEVSFLPIEPNIEDNNLRDGYEENHANETKKSRNIIDKIQKIDKYTINRLLIKKKAGAQNKVFESFRKNILHIQGDEANQEYDLCVIGSDEVFNCNVSSAWGFTSQLFGNVRQAKKVITYAASCGSTEVSNVPVKVQNRIKQSFERIAAFSVRDENTKDFVESLYTTKTEMHFDPVIIGDFSREIADAKMPEKMPDHFCIVYSYYNRINDEKDIEAIKCFCKSRGMKIVSIGAPQMWIRKHIVCNPFQALKLFELADFVITDTFHGTIFASKYSKRFAVMIRPSNKNKLSDLISKLEIHQHQIETMGDLAKVFEEKHDPKRIQKLGIKERNKSINYLNRNLSL